MRKLEEELKKYAESGMYPFHMPGHKRRGGDKALKGAYACDTTEITGFDNLFDAQFYFPSITTVDRDYYQELGVLPTPTRDGYDFAGWVDANGNRVTETTRMAARGARVEGVNN